MHLSHSSAGTANKAQGKGLDFDRGAHRLLAWTLALLWHGHGALGSGGKVRTCTRIPLWEDLVVAIPGTWLAN